MTPAIARKLDLDGVDGRSASRDFGDLQLRLPFLLMRAVRSTMGEQPGCASFFL
jgi:hypothetical protein